MTREYRKELGFSNASKTKDFLTAKDIKCINWSLIDLYNNRLIDIFSRIQKTIPYNEINIESSVQFAYETIKSNDILNKLTNHGRAPESVYFSWMQGYLTTILFQPLIEKELNCNLIQNGADDLFNPKQFSRKSDPDLIDKNNKIFVEVQSGFKGSKVDIKKTKVKTPTDYEYYIACFDCFNGLFVILNTRELLELPENEWYSNVLWEGALCYTVPDNRLKPYNMLWNGMKTV